MLLHVIITAGLCGAGGGGGWNSISFLGRAAHGSPAPESRGDPPKGVLQFSGNTDSRLPTPVLESDGPGWFQAIFISL